ncbi:MAG TPA: glycosyltransferase family 1 protein [Candidatus Moranbacteria bacterium]|nr:glycosyltransferase family 1 protein [Candidatus Moranbacteria bacterium]HRZ33877.1 glycosyltransferase family 1 protein [Candidatus Moranbacteria bacterium]
MRIGIDIRLIGKKRTGDETVIFNLVKNLALIDESNEYFLFTDTKEEKNISEIKKDLGIANKNNFKTVSLSAGNKFIWNAWVLPRYLKNNPVDVYHTQYITPWFVPREIKIITTIHDISFNFFPQFIKFSDLFFLKTLIPISLKRADKIIAVSQFTREEIIKFYKIAPGKVDYVYNSISDEFLDGDIPEEKLREVKNKYALPEKFILYIGTLQPRKNIPQLIEAFARIKDRLGEFKLVICGNKQGHNYDRRIENSIETNGLKNEVIFPGFIEEKDKKSVYKLAHLFVFPSLYEGFGIPVLESMSQKVPVAASDIPSLREIAGDGAEYFNASSLDNFSQVMYSICVNERLRKEVMQSGAERINFFSWKKSAEKLLAIYKNL